MSGFDNEVVVSLGERLESSTPQAIMLMQKTATDVSKINYSGNPEGNVSANPASLCHDPTSGNVYYKASGTGNTGWQLLGTGGGEILITRYETPGTFTWTKNPKTRLVQAIGWSGGSGGGSGARYASGQAIGSGAGASGPGVFIYTLLGSDLGPTETVVVGAGGAGGASVTTDDTDGNDGSPGGVTSFGNLSTLNESVYPNWSNTPSYGRAGGLGINWSGGNTGPVINNGEMTLAYAFGGQAGLSGDATDGSNVPQNPVVSLPNGTCASYICNMGGGGAGGIDTGPDFRLAGSGGNFLSGIDGSVLLAGGAAGVSGVSNGDGSNGADGGISSGGLLLSGTGGGGGAPNPAGRGGNGGTGGKYGGGGGGGAASLNGFNSGAGGDGGSGALIVIEFLGNDPSPLTGGVQTVGATTQNLITIPLGAAAGTYQIQGQVKGFESTTPAGVGYTIFATFTTDGATATLLGQQPIFNEDPALSDADAYFVASGNNAVLQVLGVTGLTIDWSGLCTII